jgi:hypothetical protein
LEKVAVIQSYFEKIAKARKERVKTDQKKEEFDMISSDDEEEC